MIGLLNCIFSTKEVAASQSLHRFKCEVDAQDESVLIFIKEMTFDISRLVPRADVYSQKHQRCFTAGCGKWCLNLVQRGDLCCCSGKLICIYISNNLYQSIPSIFSPACLYPILAIKYLLPCLPQLRALVIFVGSNAEKMGLEPGFVR